MRRKLFPTKILPSTYRRSNRMRSRHRLPRICPSHHNRLNRRSLRILSHKRQGGGLTSLTSMRKALQALTRITLGAGLPIRARANHRRRIPIRDNHPSNLRHNSPSLTSGRLRRLR